MSNMKYRYLTVVLSLISLFFLLTASHRIYATEVLPEATGVSFSLSPSYTQLLIQPGKSVDVTYELTNWGDPSSFSFHIYRVNKTDQQETLIEKNQNDTAIKFSSHADEKVDQSFFLNSKKKKTMKIIIKAEEKTPTRTSKDYYYTLTAYNELVGSVNDGSLIAHIKTGIASVILITVSQNGAIDADPHIASFNLTESSYPNISFLGKTIMFFDSFDKIKSRIMLKNNGINFFSVEGQIISKNMFGKTSTIALIPSTPILSGSTVLKDSSSRFILPGPRVFTAHLTAYHPYTKETITALTRSYSFFILPGKLFILLGFLMLVIFFISRKRKPRT